MMSLLCDFCFTVFRVFYSPPSILNKDLALVSVGMVPVFTCAGTGRETEHRSAGAMHLWGAASARIQENVLWR